MRTEDWGSTLLSACLLMSLIALTFVSFTITSTRTVNAATLENKSSAVSFEENRDYFFFGQLSPLPTYIYLTWSTPDTSHTINVSWSAGENYVGQVRYDISSHGGDPSAYKNRAIGTSGLKTPQLKGYIYHVELTGLKPDTIYYFVCGNPDNGWSSEQSFRTAPDKRTSFIFAVGGDSRDDDRYYYNFWPSMRDNITREVAQVDPSFVLFLGDFIWSGDNPGANFASSDTWDNWLGAWYKYARTSDNRLIPIIPNIGNHEIVYPEPFNYDPNTQAINYYTIFDLPGAKRWYALSWGPDLRIIVLDSEVLDNNSEAWNDQLQFLQSELENSKNYLWKVVIFHTPIVSSGGSGEGGGGFDYQGRLESWGYLFTKYGVDVVFQGHIHYYDRSLPINSNPPPGIAMPLGEGVTYVVSGGWGAPLSYGTAKDYTARGPVGIYNFTTVNIYDNGALYEKAESYNNKMIDNFAIQKNVVQVHGTVSIITVIAIIVVVICILVIILYFRK